MCQLGEMIKMDLFLLGFLYVISTGARSQDKSMVAQGIGFNWEQRVKMDFCLLRIYVSFGSKESN